MQYAFGPLVQTEINLSRTLWNEHHIRKQHSQHNIAAKPFISYNLPTRYNVADYKKDIDEATIDELMEKVTTKPSLVDKTFTKIIEEKCFLKVKVNNADEALKVYLDLLPLFEISID